MPRKPFKSTRKEPNFLADGRRAFNSGRYTEALRLWQSIPVAQRPPALQPALAEAQFRQLLNAPTAEGWQKLHQQYPQEERVAYHYGRYLHQQGQTKQAIPLYEPLLTSKHFGERVAPLLALALLTDGQDVEQTAVWSHLTPAWQQHARQVAQFRRRPYRLVASDSAVWQAVVAYTEQPEAAADLLQTVTAHTATLAEQVVGHYLLGNLAAQAEDWATTVTHWQFALDKGLQTADLQANLAQAYYRQSIALLEQKQIPAAYAAIARAAEMDNNDKGILDLYGYLAEVEGTWAAKNEDWAIAYDKFQKAQELTPAMRTAYNLALVCEKLERYEEAGAAWRQALRRRPRKAGSENFLTEAQISRLWQRAAENYTRAELYDEATAVYKAALKFEPDNIELRSQLAESLFENGRLQGAANELERVLERQPNHVPTLVKLGEIEMQRRPWWGTQRATELWQQALDIEPTNIHAQLNLKEFYEEWLQRPFWGGTQRQAILEEALRYFPHHIPFLIEQAHLLLKNGDSPSLSKAQVALATIRQVHAEDPEAHFSILHLLLVHDKMAEVEAHIHDIKTNLAHLLTPPFYVELGGLFLKHKHQEQAMVYFEHALQTATPEQPVHYAIAVEFLQVEGDNAQVRAHLQQAIQQGEKLAQVHLLLAVLEAAEGNARASQRSLRAARRAAQKEKNNEFAEYLEQASVMLSMPGMASIMLKVMSGQLPQHALFNAMMRSGFLMDDEDEEDDDDWF